MDVRRETRSASSISGEALTSQPPDHSILFGYTATQTEWMDNSEHAVWATLIDAKSLYAADEMTITHFMGDGPHNLYLPAESPAKIGPWVGYRIVKQWAEKKNLRLDAVLKQSDAQKILTESEYRPEATQ
jgi:uncharacterized protein YjaZ